MTDTMIDTTKRPRRRRGTGTIFKQGRVWWVRFKAHGRRVSEAAGPSRQDALNLLKARLEEVAAKRYVPPTDVVASALFNALVARLVSRHKRARTRLGYLARFLDVTINPETRRYEGGWKVDRIDLETLERYVTQRREDGAADSTMAKELGELHAAFNAYNFGKKAKVPMPDFPPPWGQKLQNVRESYFSVEQLDRLAAALPDHLRPAMWFAMLTGWRAANVFDLTWEQVDFGRGVVSCPFGVTKNGDPIESPFTVDDDLHRLLRQQEQVKRGPFVFHYPDGRPCRRYHTLWQRAVLTLGDEAYGKQYDPATRTHRRVLKRWHDLRHSFAQHMTDAGVAEGLILELGGWQSRMMLERYRIQPLERKRAAVAKRDAHVSAEREREAGVLRFPEQQRVG